MGIGEPSPDHKFLSDYRGCTLPNNLQTADTARSATLQRYQFAHMTEVDAGTSGDESRKLRFGIFSLP